MRIEQVVIGELPPEMGPSGQRLVVVMPGRWESVLVDQPINAVDLAQRLRLLAHSIEDWARFVEMSPNQSQ